MMGEFSRLRNNDLIIFNYYRLRIISNQLYLLQQTAVGQYRGHIVYDIYMPY